MVSSNDVQRLFLQALFSRGILSFKYAQVLWSRCINAVKGQITYPTPRAQLTLSPVADPSLAIRFDDSRQAWDKFTTEINTSLNSLDLEFRHLIDEQSGVEMWAIVRPSCTQRVAFTDPPRGEHKRRRDRPDGHGLHGSRDFLLQGRRTYPLRPGGTRLIGSCQVEQIMLAPREAYSVSSLAALREVGSLKSNMTKSQAEAVLGSLVAKGWLLKSKLS